MKVSIVLALTLLFSPAVVGFSQTTIAAPEPELRLKETDQNPAAWRIRLVDDKLSIEHATDRAGNFDTYSIAMTLDPVTGFISVPRVNIDGPLQLHGAPGASQLRFGSNIDLQSNTSNTGPTFATNTGPTLTTLFRREAFSAPGALAYLKGEGLNSEGGSYSPQWIGFSTRNNKAGEESGYFEFMYQANGGPLQHALYIGDLGEGFPYRVWVTGDMLVSADSRFDGKVSMQSLTVGQTALSEDDVKRLLDLLKPKK